MKAAMIQMDMELGKPDENFEKAVRMTEEACACLLYTSILQIIRS